MNRTGLASMCFAFFFLAACASTEKNPVQRDYTLVFLKTGPKSGKLTEAENEKAFAGHFSNMGRLAEEHKLVLAGPFGENRHDKELRGLFVINSGDRGTATAWASTDPTTLAGVFILEYHEFSTDAPLVAMQNRNQEQRKQDEAAGIKRTLAEGARPYVLLTAQNPERARRELAPLMKDGEVFLIATMDGTQLFAVLDAQDVAGAQRRFGPILERIGPYTLDDWFATRQLANLREM